MIKRLFFMFILSTFTFNAIHANQDDVNAIVCASSQDTYQKINENWKYVAVDGILSTKSEYWEPKWINNNANTNGGIGRSATLILKTDPKHIIEALVDLINKPASLECTIALTTTKILCLKEILGEEKLKDFATRFYSLITQSPRISNINIEGFFHELPLQFISTFEGNPIPGSIAYLTNLDKYTTIKPNGNARGLNVFCVNPDQYIAFDHIFENNPQSIVIIRQDQFESFCEESDVEHNKEAHTRLCTMFNTKSDMFFTLVKNQQEKNFNFYQFFDEAKINEFIEEGAVEY